MKVLLSILCGLIVLFAGGCTLLAVSGAGLSGALVSGPLLVIPAAVAILNVMVLAALWGFATPNRGILVTLLVLDVLVVLALAATWVSLGGGDRDMNILAVLLVGGFFRSLQFTSINTLGYADIEPQRMSRATSFASMAQQLSLSAGVATGAILLHLTVAARGGGGLQPTDFVPAFLTVGVCAALSSLIYLRLPPDAGAEVSGHGAEPARQAR